MDTQEVVIVAIAVGIVCGLVPLIFGLIRGENALAFGGFVACIAGGFVLGLILAVPLAILFTVLISKRSKRRAAMAGMPPAYQGPPQSPAQWSSGPEVPGGEPMRTPTTGARA
jgi:hypothetical protein